MLAGARWIVSTAAVLSVAAPLHTGSVLRAQASAASCGYGNRLWRGAVGGTLGGWAGLVAMKIRYSDWNDASRSRAGIQRRNQGIIVGAIVGASVGNLRFRSPCRPRGTVPTAPRSHAQSPISPDEIERAGITGTVYDLVFALRRNWLNTRGPEALPVGPRVVTTGAQQVLLPGEPELVVYLDNVRLGPVDELRKLAVGGVTGVRFYDGPEATYRWGAGHSRGAIQVLSVTDGVR